MESLYNGAAALIRSELSKAIFIHCSSHRLNLCVASCSISIVREVMDNCKAIADFFNLSPKRQDYLIENVKKHLPASNHFILKDAHVCRTIWVERIDGLERTIELHVPVLKSIEDIRFNKRGEENGAWNNNTVTLAAGLHKKLSGFEFIMALKVVSKLIGFTKQAAVLLQRTEMDLLDVKSEVNLVMDKCTKFWSNIDVEHQKLHSEAVEMATRVGETPSMPRIVTRQIHRANFPASTPEAYYRINLTENFLAHLITSREDRFGDDSLVVYKGFCIVPGVMLKYLKAKKPWRSELQHFVEFYKTDLANIEGLGAELEMWEARWLRE